MIKLHRMYCVVIIHMPDYDGQKEPVIAFVDNASDENVQFSTVGIGNGRHYAVITGGDDAISMLAAADMLKEMLESEYRNVIFCVGGIVYALNDCCLSAQQAFAALYKKTPIGSSDLSDESVNDLLEAAESGDEERAAAQFDMICRMSSSVCPVANMKQTLFLQIADAVNESAKALGLQDRNSEYRRMLLSGDMDGYLRCCHGILADIASTVKKQENGRTAIRDQVAGYIAQNVCDEMLSLDSTAAAFDLSTRQVERYTHEVFGVSFKDYITQKRIETAKKLLLQGKSVSETSAAIGYGNVTYFIKRFREKVGITPGKYSAEYERMRSGSRDQQ